MNDAIHSHPSAEQLQAFLEGELSRRKLALIEEHLSGCTRCVAEADAWRSLYEDLGSLPAHRPDEGFAERVMTGVREWRDIGRELAGLESFAPSEGFAERVMSGVELPERVPLAARIRARMASLLGAGARGRSAASAREHVPAGILQDFVDGALPETAVARVEAHVGGCERCAGELESWQLVAARLGSLGRFVPPEGFEDRVMVRLRTARATRLVPERDPSWARGLRAARGALRRVIPETRQAVAALSGAAVTPMVVIGLVVWALASHPSLTLGSLVSFAWWQLSDLATAAVAALSTVAFQSAEVFGLYSLLETLASAPTMVAGGVLTYTIFCALALRVLYKNLFANRPSGGRHAHASTAS